MKRLILPLIGLALLVITAVEVRATRGSRTAAPPVASQRAPESISAEGRVVAYPGAQVTVSTDTQGTIERLPVVEKQRVHKGEIVAVIRANDTRAALREAKARIAEADADIRLYELQARRAKRLWDEAVGSQESWDQSTRDLAAAHARRASAVAEVARLEAVIEKTVIVSPIDGVVITRDVERGESVSSGQALMSIADLSRTRIEGEVDEFDAARVRVGQNASITAEGYDGQSWQGRVEEIPDSVTTRRLKPQDSAKPIDTRVLLVKIALNSPTPLKLGQRVDLRLRCD